MGAGRAVGQQGEGGEAGGEGTQHQDEAQRHHLDGGNKQFHEKSPSFYFCGFLSEMRGFTMRHVPVWVEAILQERGMTFPEIRD